MNEIIEKLDFIQNEIAQIKTSIPTRSPFDGLLEPKEVCEKLRISRSKYEQMKQDGFIVDFEMEGGGRKRYVRVSDLIKLFPKDFTQA